ncbi:Tcb3p KNAG_0E04070 [Huiozyma naganishii CBS 8797]|uniref:Tricalbin n=1 Tax=Huiozyma naganishii (strain ATCC MYA-139 / BCRC 22969 / CBS 8797 / KCTC 17520 / NBRC 10181 / NCYC 3082 / Yp74L-3) TaxID=1071383 RepID=J7R720_HUIN7|nr:hypothetical protein KNAG_0E04070 [Kazachstania naganishii CBS 8797]CCK70660.1 hypothetical protein KNAG_0E04070 [Kazachstania naganishii CBS 8797]
MTADSYSHGELAENVSVSASAAENALAGFTSGSSTVRDDSTASRRGTASDASRPPPVTPITVPEVLVASTARGGKKLPAPNRQGTLGSVPLEALHPDQSKTVDGREANRFDTSISGPGILDEMTEEEKQEMRDLVERDNVENLFPWKYVLGFHPSGKGSPSMTNDSRVIKTYILENFYSDWWVNISLMLGTCFFAWVFAYMGLSWWSLGLVFTCAASVYSLEYRRFNRNIRDDLKRVTIDETISGKVETTQWLNSFLSKFWVIYMPVLSEQVKDKANPILAESAPGYGIEALSLEDFTMGSKAPAIRGIKSYTKKGKDVVEMDWSFAFTPNDVSDMTQVEIENKVNPRISLGVTLGKSIVSKTLSVLVENINVAGKIHVSLKFGKVFPNIRMVSVQLIEPPLIDFVLKPLGGDALGLDVMSFLPGLKSFVKRMIDSIAGPMLYAPNHLDIDVEEIMSATANDANGVVAITLSSASNLVGSTFITNTVDPYIVLKLDKPLPGSDTEVRTSIKDDIKNPIWNETKYILVNSLDQKLTMSCFDFNDVRTDQLIGTVEFDLSTLYQSPAIENTSSDLRVGSKRNGSLNYSIHFFPALESKKSIEERKQKEKEKMRKNEEKNEENKEDGEKKSEEEYMDDDENEAELPEDECDSGILKFTLEKIKNLPVASAFSNSLSPSVELYLDSKLIKKYRTLKRINEPAWNESIEFLVFSKANSKMTLIVYNVRSNGKNELCRYTVNVDDFLNMLDAGQDTLSASPSGNIGIMAAWKPVKLTGAYIGKSSSLDPLGCLRIDVGQGQVMSTLSGIGDIDPYFTVSINKHIRYKSRHYSDTMDPKFNTTVYLPIVSENQVLSIAMADYQSVGADRRIGSITMPLSKIIEMDKKSSEYSCTSKFAGDKKKFNLRNKNGDTKEDYLELGFSFIPTKKVFSPDELEKVKEMEKELKEKKEKFEKEQEELKKEMQVTPADYHIVEINDPFEELESKISKKDRMSLDEFMNHNSGVLTMHILKGYLSSASTYLNVLVDSVPYPQFVTPIYNGSTPIAETNNIFVRDLKNSKLLFRVTRKRVPKRREDVVAEYYVSTLSLLKSGYSKPTKIQFNGNTLDLRFMYNPTIYKLPSSEGVLDTGIITMNLIGGNDLMPADRNGKSDPFVYIYVDGAKVYKSQIIKKTLDPVWNENVDIPVISKSRSQIRIKVLDWDRAGANDYLGEIALNLHSITQNKKQSWEEPLNTQGTLRFDTIFVPQYIKPDVECLEKSKMNNAPMKAIGSGANAVTGTAGAVVGVAAGGVKAGSKLFKHIGGGRLRRSSDRGERPDGEPTFNNPFSRRRSRGGSVESSAAVTDTRTENQSIDEEVNNNDTESTENRRLGNPLKALRRSLSHSSGSPGDVEGGSEDVRTKGFAIPNIIPHHNQTAGDATSHVSAVPSSSSTQSYKGRISVLAATNVGKYVQVVVSVVQKGTSTPVLKTQTKKASKDGTAYYQAETAPFAASSNATLEFTAIESRKLAKDKKIGSAKISLSNPHLHGGEKAAVDIAPGRIIFQIDHDAS